MRTAPICADPGAPLHRSQHNPRASLKPTALPGDPERLSNAPHSFRQIRAHQLIGEPKHPIAEPRERPIAPSIRGVALSEPLPTNGKLVALPVLGGVQHDYRLAA